MQGSRGCFFHGWNGRILRKLSQVMKMRKSIWTETVSLPTFAPMNRDEKTDVLIIGGGMAGILSGHMLRQAGVDCLVIEADGVGGGITAGTTAKITSQHGLIYHQLLKRFDRDTVLGYYQANQAALEEYSRLAGRIDCDFEVKDNFIYSLDAPEKLEEELKALFRLGIPAEFTENLPLPIATCGAVCFRDQAQFHPLKFLAGLVGELNIRERTRALKIEKGRVITHRGRIQAEKIIVATHFPILNRRGLYFMKQYQARSYVLALEGAQDVGGMYLNASGEGFSFRNHGDALILGGGSYRTGKQTGGWEKLSAFAQAHYPGSREVGRWAAQDCMTLDGLPYIGRYSPGTPWLYVATGFNKWGMTSSMVSALVLRDLVLGRENPWERIFDPARRLLLPQLAVNGWESAVNLLKFTRPRCSHLGCALKWNPWEHSWDCPCHGSRFDREGSLLDNPALSDLAKKPSEDK